MVMNKLLLHSWSKSRIDSGLNRKELSLLQIRHWETSRITNQSRGKFSSPDWKEFQNVRSKESSIGLCTSSKSMIISLTVKTETRLSMPLSIHSINKTRLTSQYMQFLKNLVSNMQRRNQILQRVLKCLFQKHTETKTRIYINREQGSLQVIIKLSHCKIVKVQLMRWLPWTRNWEHMVQEVCLFIRGKRMEVQQI